MKAETKPAYDNTQSGTGEQHPVVDELRRLLAEMIGTFALTIVAAGGEVIALVSGGEVSHAARMVAPGLLVMAMTYTLANLSGAHFNPVVTLAFTLRQDFPWKRVPGYWIAQFTGAILAALLLRLLFGTVGKIGAARLTLVQWMRWLWKSCSPSSLSPLSSALLPITN